MSEQYVVLVRKGTYEDSDVPALPYFVTVEEPVSAERLAVHYRDVMKLAVDEHNEAYVTPRSRRLTPFGMFRDMFSMTLDSIGETWEVFDDNGWHNRPSGERITKVVILDGMDRFLETDENGAWLPHKITAFEELAVGEQA
jgi:hypothetical protein